MWILRMAIMLEVILHHISLKLYNKNSARFHTCGHILYQHNALLALVSRYYSYYAKSVAYISETSFCDCCRQSFSKTITTGTNMLYMQSFAFIEARRQHAGTKPHLILQRASIICTLYNNLYNIRIVYQHQQVVCTIRREHSCLYLTEKNRTASCIRVLCPLFCFSFCFHRTRQHAYRYTPILHKIVCASIGSIE